jgi:DNA repair protein NreA
VPTANEIKKQLEENWIQFLNLNYAKLSLKTFAGATPPSVFVGRYGYPKVKVGPMVPPFHGDTTILDRPEIWLGKTIEEIVKYRLSLVRGISDIDVHTTSGNYIESLQELAMASKSVESEATFEKIPVVEIEQERDRGLDTESAPFGPVAPLKNFKTSSFLSVDQRLENAYYDKDLRASEAVVELYKKGLEISRIHRVLSLGMLGLQKNRRLVPTRWSISATDDIISASLIKDIDDYPTIDFFELYKYSHLGNYYSIILIPDDVWNFEMQEAWFDNNGNLGIGLDFEDAKGLDHYPSIAGAYFAARLGVAEYLLKRERKAAALVLREIHPEYVMPVGVWQIREGIREAFKAKGKEFESFEKALSFASMNSSIHKDEWIKNSKIYRNNREQMRITAFFSKNNDVNSNNSNSNNEDNLNNLL